MTRFYYLLFLIIFIPGTINAGSISVMVGSEEYHIVDEGGAYRIDMKGFNNRFVPGEPVVPVRKCFIAIPPGATVSSVNIKGINPVNLPGQYRLEPAPPIVPLLDPAKCPELTQKMQTEYQRNHDAVYTSGTAFPGIRGNLESTGSIRKYRYAMINYYPFDYFPDTGTLIHYDGARINIEYTLPPPGTAEFQYAQELNRDRTADLKARELFVNYEQIKELYEPADLTISSLSEHYDYVIITDPKLSSSITASDFIDWKKSLGYTPRILVVSDTEIMSQPGHDLAEQIRNFLRNYYPAWGIQYVLLVGDYETVPMRYCYPDPTNHSHNPGSVLASTGEVPTDHYYADLSLPDDASWDLDGDGYYGEYVQDMPDFAPEVYVGRIPTNNTSSITNTLNKIVAFEQDTGRWKHNALHAGAILFFEKQDHTKYPYRDGATVVNAIEKNLMSGWTLNRYSEQSGLVKSSYIWNSLTESNFITDWRTGKYGVVNWAGHGWSDRVARTVWSWDDGDNIPESSGPSEISTYDFISTSSNLDSDYPSIMFAVSCLVGYPEFNSYGRLGVNLLTSSAYGSASAVISSTRVAWVHKDYYLCPYLPAQPGAESLCYEFNRFLINATGGPQKVGEALYNGKFYSHTNYGWGHYAQYHNMYNYNLYGDPSMVREGINPNIHTGNMCSLIIISVLISCSLPRRLKTK